MEAGFQIGTPRAISDKFRSDPDRNVRKYLETNPEISVHYPRHRN
ncbi:unnamed protein product, partial [Adineta ricciae]